MEYCGRCPLVTHNTHYLGLLGKWFEISQIIVKYLRFTEHFHVFKSPLPPQCNSQFWHETKDSKIIRLLHAYKNSSHLYLPISHPLPLPSTSSPLQAQSPILSLTLSRFKEIQCNCSIRRLKAIK